MPQWLHARAEHILAKNPSMPKSEAFAIATQQSHALGKTPKSYGTLQGREEAKTKYKTPGDDQKTAMFTGAVRALEEELKIDLGKVAFKLHGHTEHQGIPIAIENRKGSVRSGVDRDGKPWRTKMVHPYGYIKGSKGADGEEVDAYVGPHDEATHAYVVHQHKSDGKGYDEDKVMLGFPSKDEAVKGYLKHYTSDKFLGPVKEVPIERLKEMLQMKKKLVKISSFAEKLAELVLEDFLKEANLSDSESAHFKELLKERSDFEQQSRKGIDPALHQRMLHNVERLKHYQQKKRDASHSIPPWVGKKNAGPPSSTFRRSGGAAGHAAGTRAQAAAIAHGVRVGQGFAIGGAVGTAYARKKQQSDPKSFVAKHPGLTAAGGAVGGAALVHKLTKAATAELCKMGEISEQQAQRALERYETLERQKPSGTQVGRYAALGALAGPTAHVVGNLGRGKGLRGAVDVAKDVAGNPMAHGKLRTLAGTATAGGLTTGVVPLVRTHLDRNAERGTLKRYLGEQGKEKDSSATGATPARPWAADEPIGFGKYGFAESQYSSHLGSPRFPQESSLPPFRVPSLRSTVSRPSAGIVEKIGMSATPMGSMASAKRVGLPKVTAPPGPAIADQVGTFGRRLPGANKTVIGKGL